MQFKCLNDSSQLHAVINANILLTLAQQANEKFVLFLSMPRQIRLEIEKNRSRNKTKVTQVLKHFAFHYISTPAYQYRQEYALLQNLVAQVL